VEKEKPWAITATTEELIEAYGDEIKGWLELQMVEVTRVGRQGY